MRLRPAGAAGRRRLVFLVSGAAAVAVMVASAGPVRRYVAEHNGVYKTSLGVATTHDIRDRIPRMLENHFHFRIVRADETASGVRLETAWREQPPSEAETARGITGVRTRIRVESRPRILRMQGEATLQRVRFRGETMVRRSGADDWRNEPLTERAREELHGIAGRIKLELEASPRTF